MKTAIGYIVLETCDDYEQVLALDEAPNLPTGGILTWSDVKKPRTAFPTRKHAKEAIDRTEHYRLAFGRTDLPTRAYCRVARLDMWIAPAVENAGA